MSVRATRSSAPDANVLLGRATGDLARVFLPGLVSSVLRLEALVRGERWLAGVDRAFDVDAGDGRRLRAFDALSGSFMIHLGRTHIALPPEGGEDRAVVRTHAHAPDASVGFYNARVARTALAEVTALIDRAIASPETKRVDRIRAENTRARLARTEAHLDALLEAIEAHPTLARLEEAAQLAHDVKRPGDRATRALAVTCGELVAWLERAELAPELAAVVTRDLETIAADRDKWLDYHAPTVGAYYLRRRLTSPG